MQDQSVNNRKEEWGGMLDRLCKFTTPEEEVLMREMAANSGVPRHLIPLHDYVTGQMVKYGIVTWHLMRTRFIGEAPASHNAIPVGVIYKFCYVNKEHVYVGNQL
jgi:hypothetical protein